MEIDSTSRSSVTGTFAETNLNRKMSLAGIRPWTWFVIDFGIAYFSATLAFALTPHTQSIDSVDHVGQFPFALGLALVVALTAHVAGLHELNQRRESLKLFARCLLVSVLAVVFVNAELLFVHYLKLGRLITVFALIGCVAGLFLTRTLIVGAAVRNTYMVALVGSKKYLDKATDYLKTSKADGLEIITLDFNEFPDTNLHQWVHEMGVDQVVVDTDDPLAPSENDLLKLIDGRLSIATYTSFVENLFERVPSQHITAQWVLDTQSAHASLYKTTLKRVTDLMLSLMALVLMLPVMVVVAVAIKIESPGPVVFKQRRVGQYGRLFTMYKFRSMAADAEKNGAQWATTGDSRVTRIGQFLRASRLDELPQLINVIAGHMSLVGPRPERPEFTQKLESNIPFFVHRLLVKPGITGWAQINAAYAASEEDSVTKLSFDLYYVKTLSFAMDLRIMLRTISRFAKGAR